MRSTEVWKQMWNRLGAAKVLTTFCQLLFKLFDTAPDDDVMVFYIELNSLNYSSVQHQITGLFSVVAKPVSNWRFHACPCRKPKMRMDNLRHESSLC